LDRYRVAWVDHGAAKIGAAVDDLFAENTGGHKSSFVLGFDPSEFK
jgi:hypothetical protein